MKKIILSAAILAFAGITSVKASDNISKTTPIVAVQDSTTKTAIELSALPDAVKATLQSDKYKEWTPTAAFEVKNGNTLTHYQVDAKKEQETISLKIGADGVVVE